MRAYTIIKILVFVGAITMLGGFVSGEILYKNSLVHGLVDIVDMKDETCQKASVASGVSCPMGCKAKPLSGPELSGRAPECRSFLWVATCSTECEARDGLIRVEDGQFLESSTFIVQLNEPPNTLKEDFIQIDVALKSLPSGLWRHRALYSNPDDELRVVEKMEAKIKKIPYVVSVERILK